MMNVVYAMTRNVYPTLLPSLRSLVNKHPDARVFILAEDDKLPFDLPIDAEVINVFGQGVFAKDSVNYNNRFKYINLLKVCYPSLLPVDRVLHLDTDTIVCDNLDQLWNTDLDGKWFAACPEYLGWYKPFGDRYYNMGVALINLEQMRIDDVERPMIWYLTNVKQPWADQDAWNLYGIGSDKVVTLPVRYNESVVTGTTDRPAIVHFCSTPDWWSNKSMNRRELLDEWL